MSSSERRSKSSVLTEKGPAPDRTIHQANGSGSHWDGRQIGASAPLQGLCCCL